MRRLLAAFGLAMLMILGLSATSAQAASYAKGVYEPLAVGTSTIEGWSDVNTNCEGTFGCYTYTKIEFLPDNAARPPWLNHAAWEFGSGYWAKDGWNRVSMSYKGCGTYRTVVESYNDAPGDAVLGISLGPVEANLGGGIKRYYKHNSAQKHICLMA